MEPWGRSAFTVRDARELEEEGFLRPQGDPAALAWIIPENEEEPVPPSGHVVSFKSFHECGFGVPASRFLRRILGHYGVELQNLNPNGVLHLSVFVGLCEGFLGIDAHFGL